MSEEVVDIQPQQNTKAHIKDMLLDADPIDPGGKLSLSAAKKMYQHKERNFSHPSLLPNKILKQKADDIDRISRQYGLGVGELNEEQKKDLYGDKDHEGRLDEFNKQLYHTYDVKPEDIKENIILPLPHGWNSPYLEMVQAKQPAWTGQYIQLRKDQKTGEMKWVGYNKPSAMEDELPTVTVSALIKKKEEPGLVKVKSPLTGQMETRYNDNLQKFWDKVGGGGPAQKILKTEEGEGNYSLTTMMSKHPEVWNKFKELSEKAIPEDLSTAEGNRKLVGESIGSAYSLNKKISEVQKSYSDFEFNSAIESFDRFNDYTKKYSRQQDKLSSQIELIGKAHLKETGWDKKLDQVQKLRVQMLRNPDSLSEVDKNTYYSLNRELVQAVSSLPETSKYVEQFHKNASEYESEYKKRLPEMALFGTPDGKKALDLLQKQAVGFNLLNTLSDKFPGLKKKEEQQQKLNQGTDRISMLKSLVRGLNMGFQALNSSRETVANWMGLLSKDDIAKEQMQSYGRYDDLNTKLATPIRPEGNEFITWNKVKNFLDNTAQMTGSMVPYLAAGAAAPELESVKLMGKIATMTPEGAMFAMDGYNSYYREARESGLNDSEAKTRGVLGGIALALTQGIIPKGQLVKRAGINKELDELVKLSAKPDAVLIKEFLGKFVNEDVFRNTYKGGLAAISNDVAQAVLDISSGKPISHPITPGGMFEQTLMFGVMASATHGLFKGGGRDREAMNAIVYGAHERPLQTLKAIDDAIMFSHADDSYDRKKLELVQQNVAQAVKMQYPAHFTTEQRVATFDLVKEKKDLHTEMQHVDPDLKGSYEEKIHQVDAKIRDVANSHEKAMEHLDKQMKPIYEHLEKQGYFDQVQEAGKGNKIVQEGEGKVLAYKQGEPLKGDDGQVKQFETVEQAKAALEEHKPATPQAPVIRHAETDGNIRGVNNGDKEPLNERGRQQAKELGQKLKQQQFKDIMTSPMERARETAEIAAQETGGKIIPNENLREWSFNKEGQPYDEAERRRLVNNPDEKSSGGESFNEFLSRVQKARNEAEQMPTDAAIMTHGEVKKLWDALDKSDGKWNDLSRTEYLKNKEVPNAQLKESARGIGKSESELNIKKESVDKDISQAEPQEKFYHDERKRLLDKYGMDSDEIIKKLKEDGRLKVKCPPGKKVRTGRLASWLNKMRGK